MRWQRIPLTERNLFYYQGAIQGGMVDNLLQLGGKLLGGIISQQSKNPTKQLLNNGIAANQQQKPVMNVQQLQVSQKPQVGET